MRTNLLFSLMGLVGLLQACKSEDAAPAVPVSGSYTFESDREGWQAGYADYRPGQEESIAWQYAHSSVPENLSPRTYSVFMSGNNRSDDLFMFLKKQFTGLQPHQTYQLTFELIIVSKSNLPADF